MVFTMKFLSKFTFLFLFLFGAVSYSNAQNVEYVVVANGGLFGTTNYTNINLLDRSTGISMTLDTIYETAVQDVLLEKNGLISGDNYAYVAATDSIVKYNLTTGDRIAATKFKASSTINLERYGDKLLAGTWYGGGSTQNFHIFDADSLTYVDSITQITKPAKDFAVVGNFAYIAQNSTTSSFSDTLGYLAVVDLTTMTWVRNDTLSTMGHEIGRLLVEDSIIYTLNGTSNTISTYNVNTQVGTTQAAVANVDLKPKSYAATGFPVDGAANTWYIPFDSGIGSYNLATNTIVDANIVKVNGSYAFTFNSESETFYVSTIVFGNQQNNKGWVYDKTGTQTDSFTVGFSPEALASYTSTGVSVNKINSTPVLDYSIYPNPTQDILHIALGTLEEVTVEVYNQFGQQLQSQILSNEIITINTTNLATGIYYVKLTNERGATQTKRFVKK